MENIMYTTFEFTLELINFDAEISEEDAAFIKALTGFGPDELNGKDLSDENTYAKATVSFLCEAYISTPEKATQHSPPCPGFAELHQVEVIKGGKPVELDIDFPYSLIETIEHFGFEEWGS
jgi:hypothetical protein